MHPPGTELEILDTLLQWQRAGLRAWLCTIVRTIGSSPRPAGSMMVCNELGAVSGSLSGGCVEEELIRELLDLQPGAWSSPQQRVYGISAEENERLSLPCGGRLEILVEPCDGKSAQLQALAKLCDALRERRPVCRVVELANGGITVEAANRYQAPQIVDGQLRHCFVPRMRMLLVGAGQLSACLAELAERLDYRVSVCDPRSDVLHNWQGPAGVERVAGMPDDFLRDAGIDVYTVVITLTHDPRIDDMALMEALRQPAFYVGALGSARTSAARRQRLEQLDLDAEQIDRLHAPVGLAIGSKRPLEIAIAILAELTQLRHADRGS